MSFFCTILVKSHEAWLSKHGFIRIYFQIRLETSTFLPYLWTDYFRLAILNTVSNTYQGIEK
jgi:hypothetical protein